MLRASYYSTTSRFITIFLLMDQSISKNMPIAPNLSLLPFFKRKIELFGYGKQDGNGPAKEDDQKDDELSD